MGRSLVRTGIAPNTIAVNNVSHDWIYNTWLPFKKSAELNPLFIRLAIRHCLIISYAIKLNLIKLSCKTVSAMVTALLVLPLRVIK